MKSRLCTNSVALFSALLLASAFNQTTRASSVIWNRIDVDAHLDNSGALHVRERMFVTVDGEMPSLDRRIATSTDQVFILRRLVREDNGQETELTEGWDKKDQYMWRNQTLTWWIRNVNDPKWSEQPLVYRFDYELRNALAPAWDIPAGNDPLLYPQERFPRFFERLRPALGAWAQAPATFSRRYRLDHDVIFPWFSEREREELKYTLRYDEAWRRVHPESDIGRGTRGRDFRVTQLLDYLAPGWPPAIELWKPATRVGSIFAFALLSAIFWVAFAVGAIRRWGLIPPRLNRRWFEEHLGRQRPEILAWILGQRGIPQFVAPFLGQLRANGVIAVRSESAADEQNPPTIHLQLRRDPAALQPHERQMLSSLFPEGAESGSALLARFYAKTGFRPDEELEEAIDDDFDKRAEAQPVLPPSSPLFWRIVRRLLPFVFWSAAALLVLDAFHDHRPMELILVCILLVVVVGALPQLIARFETPSSGSIAALVTLVPVLVAAIAVVAMHFYENFPLTAAGSAGLALVALWTVGSLLFCEQDADPSSHAQQKRIAALGARYARRELRKSRPSLDDTWVPHLLALGLAPQIANWRERRAAGGTINSGAILNTGPAFDAARPFTGASPFLPDERWIYALYIPSEDERREEEEDEDEDEDEDEREKEKTEEDDEEEEEGNAAEK